MSALRCGVGGADRALFARRNGGTMLAGRWAKHGGIGICRKAKPGCRFQILVKILSVKGSISRFRWVHKVLCMV